MVLNLDNQDIYRLKYNQFFKRIIIFRIINTYYQILQEAKCQNHIRILNFYLVDTNELIVSVKILVILVQIVFLQIFIIIKQIILKQ
ncbi:unnamed protein product [Paramecium pentaurelia]|uniref:Transmembrane protein n=1 Tax=Paramecium pentaurelia TaxID=43138 RepID=A0A8S1WJ38_9CILI|nr:unnamed protein product [Paramecium pentaurelia]